MKGKVLNPEEVRENITEYYRNADIWVPPESSWRVWRFDCLNKDGSTTFLHVKDRIDSKKKLRKHLVEKKPVNVYFSVSYWLNPTKTRYKTYKKKWDGRYHADKNHFLYSDIVIDFDHRDTEEVEKVWNYLTQVKGIPEEKLDLVFSGGGWHINVWKWYRNRDTPHPIEREKEAHQAFQMLCQELADQGFEFDYQKQDTDNGVVFNSPTGDTRRVRKLPNTVTKYGNKAELVSKTQLHSYTEEKLFEIRRTSEGKNLSERIEEASMYV